jgi:hypothetical protein
VWKGIADDSPSRKRTASLDFAITLEERPSESNKSFSTLFNRPKRKEGSFSVGALVGEIVGDAVGDVVGELLGVAVGDVGSLDFGAVGAAVGTSRPASTLDSQVGESVAVMELSISSTEISHVHVDARPVSSSSIEALPAKQTVPISASCCWQYAHRV